MLSDNVLELELHLYYSITVLQHAYMLGAQSDIPYPLWLCRNMTTFFASNCIPGHSFSMSV